MGPSLLGSVAEVWTFGVAWLLAAALLSAAAASVHLAGRMIPPLTASGRPHV